MKELSLHILDIVQNSITAKASLIELYITEDDAANRLTIGINDNGCGMTREFVDRIRDPFTTTRSTRKVGMGIPLYEQAAVLTGGSFDIQSEPNVGTKVTAIFVKDSIDLLPLGDMTETMVTLVSNEYNSNVEFVYTHTVNGNTFTFDTRQIKAVLGEVPLYEIEVVLWLKDYIKEGLQEINASCK